MDMTDLSLWLEEELGQSVTPLDQVASQAEERLSRLRHSFKTQNFQEVMEEIAAQLVTLETVRQKLSGRLSLDPSDRRAREALDAAADYLLEFLCANSDLFKLIAESIRGKRAASLMGDGFGEEAGRLAAAYHRDILPDLVREKEMVSQQLSRLNEASLSLSRPASVSGEARRMLQSLSRERRMRAYHSLVGRVERVREDAASQMVELHELRRAMSGRAGFQTFYDYALVRSGQRESDRTSMARFRQLVEEHLAPLTRSIRSLQWKRLSIQDPKPWDLMLVAPFGLPQLDGSAFPLEETFLKAMAYLDPEALPVFETMQEAGLLSLQVAADGRGEALSYDLCSQLFESQAKSAVFQASHASFLLVPKLPPEWFAETVFSETGSMLLDLAVADKEPCPLSRFDWQLGRQLARQSLSFLSRPFWGLFYGSMAVYARQYSLTELALSLPLICALDEMDEFLCRARVTNMNVFRHAWREIAGRYRLDGTAEDLPGLLPLDDLWLFAPGLWGQPLEGICQALAQVSVLGTLPLGRHHELLETSFGLFLQEGGHGPLLEQMSKAGYPSPFEEETFRKAAFALVDYLGL